MAMNFWEAQRRAKKKTTIYLSLFIFLTITMAIACEYALRLLAPEDYDPNYPIFGFIFLIITFGVALFEYSMYASFGGSYVAENVGGYRIDSQTTDFKERQLLNIVQEMTLSASLPMPPVYILPADEINAFAAGLKPNNAAIAITRGALQTLNRDEIQGVIAHEVGHIRNGDMKISMRLAAMVMGFFFLLYFSLRILQFTPRSRDNDRNGGVVMIAALLMIIAGVITWFLGSILKAAVSRQREYLADASAVQFTRNPEGIANALRKIAKEQRHDLSSSGMAYSHMYLDSRPGINGLFATHPPLKKRIEAIENRTYIPEDWEIEEKDQ
ncbi:hypothetical protein BN1013_02029 [Candidatus Rubidus massiliensis]|nr:hypothetical protein BN1013_02029 [Candidatus Rubidus massiliensis]